MLYLSIVNVGQIWYSFGWESLLLETGFIAIFLGSRAHGRARVVLWLLLWLLFRLEFGAGLIKMRGDRAWRDLTALHYHHETQPMPGPLSWYFHHLPPWAHKAEVVANHITQLIVPFALFAPQPVASVAAGVVIVTQGWLVLSGNFSWLNFLAITLAVSAIDGTLVGASPPDELATPPTWYGAVVLAVTALVVVLSYWPVRNLLRRKQVMNYSFNQFHLVNTYGAFGTVTRERYEVIFEGTDEDTIGLYTTWREYEFKGKPGDPYRSRRRSRRTTYGWTGCCGSCRCPPGTEASGCPYWSRNYSPATTGYADCCGMTPSKEAHRNMCGHDCSTTGSPPRRNVPRPEHGGYVDRWAAWYAPAGWDRTALRCPSDIPRYQGSSSSSKVDSAPAARSSSRTT